MNGLLVVQGPLSDDEECLSCGQEMPAGTEALVVFGQHVFCSWPCLMHELTDERKTQGMDFTAAQDQALAMAADILKKKPKQFALLWDQDGEHEDIGVTLFCHPFFTVACVQALAEALANSVPEVNPPES